LVCPIFAARFEKKQGSLRNKLIFTPNNWNKKEKKFGRNIQGLTFALPLKKRVAVMPKDL
jgi:hypothetical protein